jgi:hypothetical protein
MKSYDWQSPDIHRTTSRTYHPFYVRRAARLLVPFIFWTALYLAYRRIHNHTGCATLSIDTLKG